MAPTARARPLDPKADRPIAPAAPSVPPPRRGFLLSCRLKVTLPEGTWIREFTVAHPELRVEVLDRLELGNGRTLLELRVISEEPGSWDAEIRRLPTVKEVECLDSTEGSTIYRVAFRGQTFIPFLKRLGLLRHFPFPIQGGVATWTVVGPDAKGSLGNNSSHSGTLHASLWRSRNFGRN